MLEARSGRRTLAYVRLQKARRGRTSSPIESNKIDSTRKMWFDRPPPGAQDAADNNLVVNIS